MTHDQQLIFLRIFLREKRENALRNNIVKETMSFLLKITFY